MFSVWVPASVPVPSPARSPTSASSGQVRDCECGCGKRTRKGADYHSDCKNECKCGCGGRARYAYAPGHRPKATCNRCGKGFSPTEATFSMCSQCRRHVRDGRPETRNEGLVSSRKMQAKSPPGKRWCSGCSRYRSTKFFGRSGGKFYSRCKPCHKIQQRAAMLPKTYGITLEQYEQIKEAQGGVCYICQIATGASKALAVDHDHSCCPGKTSCGQCVRGLACAACNKMLGFARDNVEFFERAIRYLTSPPAHEVIGRKKPDG